MKPSDIERTKMPANALDRASTSCLTIGVLAPIAAALYGLSGNPVGLPVLIIGSSVWLFAAIALHLVARKVLKGLDP